MVGQRAYNKECLGFDLLTIGGWAPPKLGKCFAISSFYHQSACLEIFADQQSRCGSFSGGRGDLFSAARSHVASCKDTGDAGLQDMRVSILETVRAVAVMDQVVTGDDKAPLVCLYRAAF